MEEIVSNRDQGLPVAPSVSSNSFEEISFVPSSFGGSEAGALPSLERDKFAFAGIVIGTLSLIAWMVIIFGILVSLGGIIFSVLGLKSSRQRYARIGLWLSVIGFTATVWYVLAAYTGKINYNYFTTEFWGSSSAETATK